MDDIKKKLFTYWSLLENNTSRQHQVSLVAIILAGFLLRFYSVSIGQGYTYFAINDEVTALQYALSLLAGDPDMLYLGSPALNQGNIPGPLWAMLVAALYTLGGNSAEGAVLGTVVLNTIVIYPVYRLARALLPNRYALLSTLLYSLSPWAIYYSAGLYNTVPLALLGSLLLLALWITIQKNYSNNIFCVCLLSASIPQFHMIGIFYMPVILFLLYISPYKLNIRWFIFGVLAGFTLYLPYLIGDFLKDWQNTRAILNGEGKFSFGILKILTIPMAMLSNHPGQWTGPSFDDFKIYANQYFGSYVVLIIINLLSIILSAAFIVSLIQKSMRCLRGHSYRLRTSYEKQPEIIFITLLLFLPLILYTLTGRAYTTRYSIMIFPLLFLLPSIFIASMQRPALKKTIFYSLLFLSVINIYMTLTFYKDQNMRMQTSDILMPSFNRLIEIKNSIDSNAESIQRLDISYSDTIQKLPEGQRKLYMTITDFMAAYTNDSDEKKSVVSVRKLKVLLGTEDTSAYQFGKLIYATPAIKILDLNG